MILRLMWALALITLFFPPAPSGSAPARGSQDVCGLFDETVVDILSHTTPARWMDWIEKLSGAEPVWVGGQRATIQTRYSTSMFSDKDYALGFDYVYQMVRRWVGSRAIEVDEYPGYAGTPWKNLIVTFPGKTRPEEIVILAAHLDSTSNDRPLLQAPGANDNATGAATLMEAARIFRRYDFERTVKIIFFTGEEWGMWGSKAYVQDHDLEGVVGVINMDMFGYDHDEDRCFEIHAGTLPQSDALGQCMLRAIQTYDLDLKADYLTRDARSFSDHSSFWNQGVGAVLVMENMFIQSNQPDGCGGHGDNSPHYHSNRDTVDKINLATAFDIARAGLATTASLAVPVKK